MQGMLGAGRCHVGRQAMKGSRYEEGCVELRVGGEEGAPRYAEEGDQGLAEAGEGSSD